jgi:putative nucleotidyltransferase with HDIG domain
VSQKSKKNILFVDDDPLLIRGFQRSMTENSNEQEIPTSMDWNIYFCSNSQEALKVLAQRTIDVIVTDLRLPGVRGLELLNIVAERYPEIIRFILTGNTEEDITLQAVRSAHQSIAKPLELANLRYTIERSCQLKQLLNDDHLTKIITGIRQLPSLPNLYIRLLDELQSSEPTPKVIGDIISQDITMTAKILQLVNSAFFSIPTTVTNPQRAVTILGINIIKALVLTIGVFSRYQNVHNPYFSLEELWQHSIYVGNIAKMIVQTQDGNTQMQSDAQVIGMLHDIGKLLQLEIPNFFHKYKIMKREALSIDIEYKLLGTSHAEIGAYLLGLWGLPDLIVESVAYHHTPIKQIGNGFTVLSAVHLANGLYHLCTSEKPLGYEAYLDLNYLRRINVIDKLETFTNICRNVLAPIRQSSQNDNNKNIEKKA